MTTSKIIKSKHVSGYYVEACTKSLWKVFRILYGRYGRGLTQEDAEQYPFVEDELFSNEHEAKKFIKNNLRTDWQVEMDLQAMLKKNKIQDKKDKAEYERLSKKFKE